MSKPGFVDLRAAKREGMNVVAARKYPNPRKGPLSPDQIETRRIAYAIKSTASPLRDFDTAAREMAALITGPCWLVPIPDSAGNTDANALLAARIARYCPGAEVVRAIRRTQPIQSQCIRHRLVLGPIPQAQHHFTRTRKALTRRQTYLVDNVTTSGNTLAAACAALGFGAGLVFADATSHRTRLKPLSFDPHARPFGRVFLLWCD
jgi:hypothetical protein